MENVVTYLLLGPRQLALKLLLVVEKNLVLCTQGRKTLGNLLSELRGILLRPFDHDET